MEKMLNGCVKLAATISKHKICFSECCCRTTGKLGMTNHHRNFESIVIDIATEGKRPHVILQGVVSSEAIAK